MSAIVEKAVYVADPDPKIEGWYLVTYKSGVEIMRSGPFETDKEVDEMIGVE
jgi:hypothetical protein